jgi:hypothetical protein
VNRAKGKRKRENFTLEIQPDGIVRLLPPPFELPKLGQAVRFSGFKGKFKACNGSGWIVVGILGGTVKLQRFRPLKP